MPCANKDRPLVSLAHAVCSSQFPPPLWFQSSCCCCWRCWLLAPSCGTSGECVGEYWIKKKKKLFFLGLDFHFSSFSPQLLFLCYILITTSISCLPGFCPQANLALSARGNLIRLNNSPVASPSFDIQSEWLCFSFFCLFYFSIL